MLSRLNLYSYNNIVSFASSKRKADISVTNNPSADVFVKRKKPETHNKAYRVAEILPKAQVKQKELDEIFSDDKFAKDVLDRDWYNQWKIAMKQRTPLPTTGFCYPAAEFWYHFVDNNTQPMTIRYDDKIIDPKTGKSRKTNPLFSFKRR